jgi:dihydropteroate synthase
MKEKDILSWGKCKLDFSGGSIVMGVLNVTPDSFSDGGDFFDTGKAISRGIEMVKTGAAIIDIGPESSRPGSERTGTEEQIKRVIPVIQGLAKVIDVPISIDTYDADVAEAALCAGAGIINDITAFRDGRMRTLAVRKGVPVVLMHMQGEPATMQKEPRYGDVVGEVLDFLVERAGLLEKAGLGCEKIFIDPGIGFGKTTEHNLELLRNIGKFVGSGYKVLVGTSRKRFIGELTGRETPRERVFGTAATVAFCVAAGVSIVRVHDVEEMVDVVKVAGAVSRK